MSDSLRQRLHKRLTGIHGDNYTCTICYVTKHRGRWLADAAELFVEVAWMLLPPGEINAISCEAHEAELAATLLRIEKWDTIQDIPKDLLRAAKAPSDDDGSTG